MDATLTIHDEQVSAREALLESSIFKNNEKALNAVVEYLASVASSFEAAIPAEDVKTLLEKTGFTIDTLMTSFIPLAQKYAVTPVSHFNVGAVGLGNSGAIYFGANMEFVDCFIATSVHGEQSCTANTYIAHKDVPLRRLAVSALPCGHCRQFLSEYAEGLQVKLSDTEFEPITNYLAKPFGPRDLDVEPYNAEKCSLEVISTDQQKGTVSKEVIDAAVEAAKYSFSPYSNSPSGVAIKVTRKDGTTRVFSGSYLEIAAYNPSLNPMEAAMIIANLAGWNSINIVECAVAEKKGLFSAIPQVKSIHDVVVPEAAFAVVSLKEK